MKKLIILVSIISALFAFDVQSFVKNLIGEQKYQTYKNLISQTINENNATIESVILTLKENGLIDLFFDKPKIFETSFVFKDNNPELDTKILNETLKNLGYFYFYPSEIKTNGTYDITIEMNSGHFIDPLQFLREIKNFNCQIQNITKNDYYTYTIDCSNADLNVTKLTDNVQNLTNTQGEYWVDTNGYSKVVIKTSKYDKWYPYVVFYDKNLNILNIITSKNVQRIVKAKIPDDCKYIKIRDNYSKENIKRGIFIKGIK
ncbi:hypothetical protein [Caminibacter pacificus]|jgi:hypothetical protein